MKILVTGASGFIGAAFVKLAWRALASKQRRAVSEGTWLMA